MSKMTKAQLIDENIRLRDQMAVLEQKLSAPVVPFKVVVPAAPAVDVVMAVKPDPIDFTNYWRYVDAAKAWCKRFHQPVSYKTRAQFTEAHDSYDSYDAYVDSCESYPEFPQGEFPRHFTSAQAN